MDGVKPVSMPVSRSGPKKTDHNPPSVQQLRQFAITHHRKLVLIGIATIVAGLALMAVDFFTGGLSLPLTLQIEVVLLSTGATALVGGLLGVILAEQDGGRTTAHGTAHRTTDRDPKPKVKAKGHRPLSGMGSSKGLK